jgi:uncharacterized protein (TIGR03083 family)
MVVTASDTIRIGPGTLRDVDLVVALEQAWSGVVRALSDLPEDAWQRPTPCDRWSVRDVAAHLGHLEGLNHDFPQPPPPPGFDPAGMSGLDAITNSGVAARSAWTTREVFDEVRAASAATLDRVRGFSEEDWHRPMPSPVGILPASQSLDLRLADVWVHLLDIRSGLGEPPSADREPEAAAAVIHRAVRLTGWGAVKRAGLPDGTRIAFDLAGPGGVAADLVIAAGRGEMEPSSGDTVETIRGPALAYLLEVAGRPTMAEAAGGLEVEGEAARALLERYRLFE